MARGMSADTMGVELRSALIAELERTNTLRGEARRRGVALARLIDPEFALGLSAS